MIVFKLTDDIEVVPGSFKCGQGCTNQYPSSPFSIGYNNSGVRLEWKTPVNELRIGQIWEVQFKVRAYREDTRLPVNDPSDSYILYDRFDNMPGSRDALEQLYLKVIPSVPTAPVDLNGTYNVSKIDLTWSSPSFLGGIHPSILNYKVYKGTEPGKEQYYALVDGSEMRFSDRVFLPTETYYYRVSAVNCMGEGPLSNEVSVTVPVTMFVPGKPLDVGAEPDSETIVITWHKPLKEGYSPIEMYRIYKGLSPGDSALYATVDWSNLAFVDDIVRPGIEYYYRVSAYNSVGEGEMSEEVSAEIPAEEPGYAVRLYSIHITIKDLDSWQPVSGASVLFGAMKRPLISNEWGHVLLSNVSEGERRVGVSASGYVSKVEKVTVPDSDIEVTIYLEKVYVPTPKVSRLPKVDDITVSIILLDAMLAELALLVIVYFRVMRRLDRTGKKCKGPNVRRGLDRKPQ